MANNYNINRSIEAYEFRTIDPDDGQLKNILDIAGAGNEVDLSNYYTKPETDGLFTPYYTSSQVDTLLGNHYTEAEADALLNAKLNVANPTFTGIMKGDNHYNNVASTIINNVMDNSLGEIKHYVGSPTVPDTTTNLVMTLKNNAIELHKEVNVLSNIINGRIYDTNGNTEFIIRRNGSSMINIGTDNIIYHYSNTDTDGQSIIRDRLKTNIFDSYNNTTDINFRHNDVNYLIYDVDYETNGGVIVGNIPLVLGTKLDIPLNTQLHFQHTDSYINETLNITNFLNYVMREQTGQMDFYVGDPAVGTNKVMTLQNNLITFHKPTSLGTIDDTNYVNKTGETLQIVDGAFVAGGGVQNGTDTLTVNGTTYVSGNATVNGNLYITPNGYMFNAGAAGAGARSLNYVVNGPTQSIHQFFIGNSNNLRVQFAWNDCYFTPNVVCFASVKSNAIDTHNDSDLIFNRNGVEFMKFERTLGQVEMTVGVKSSTYDSIGNADVAFRRNFVDFLYFRNGYVEVNNGVSLWSANARLNTIDTAGVSDMTFKRNGVDYLYLRNGYVEVNSSSSLWSPNARINTINTTNDTDMIFQRNGVEYFRCGTGYSTDGGAPTNIALFSAGVSADWVFGNGFANRSADTDTNFYGAVPAGNAWGKLYMRYEHVNPNLNIFADVELEQTRGLFLHRETGKSIYMYSYNTASVNHVSFVNQDPNGEIRFSTNGGTKFYVRANDMSMTADLTSSANIECAVLTQTSDKRLKTDIQTITTNCSNIVKKVDVRKYKLINDEEGKTNLGFVADEIEENIPSEFENITSKKYEYKSLNYSNLNCILWKALQEQMVVIDKMNKKITKLEKEIKDIKNPK